MKDKLLAAWFLHQKLYLKEFMKKNVTGSAIHS